jgi:hypothetical protein
MMRHRRFSAPAALLAALALGSCADRPDASTLQQAVETMGAHLPAPYRDGLVTESAQAVDHNLVLLVRFPEATYAMAVAKPGIFHALQMDEQASMRELCRVTALKPLLDAGGGVRRRFVDADGTLFFETTLAAADCTPL